MIQKFTITLVYGRLLYCMILKSALIPCWLPLLTTARVKWTAKDISPTCLSRILTLKRRVWLSFEHTLWLTEKCYRTATSLDFTLYTSFFFLYGTCLWFLFTSSLVAVSNKMCTSWNLQLHLPRGFIIGLYLCIVNRIMFFLTLHSVGLVTGTRLH